MRLPGLILAAGLLVAPGEAARPSDACSERAIVTTADVRVSDGSRFRTESYFHGKDAAAIRHLDERDHTIAVEGPFSWTRVDGRSAAGTNLHMQFALGHQYHALLLHFEEIVGKIRRTPEIRFGDVTRAASTGEYPYGGTVHLVDGDDGERPAGLVFEFEDVTVSVAFHDWRPVGGRLLPFHASIDDGSLVFDYHYTNVDTSPRSPLWFFDAVPAPDIDTVRIHRLHRRLLAAHCFGDAVMMARLSAADNVVVGGGEVHRATNDAVRELFTGTFERLNYTEYHDLAAPIVEIAESADLGWIAVTVRAVGAVRETGRPFDEQWAWVMMVRKIDGDWVHAGTASSRTHLP